MAVFDEPDVRKLIDVALGSAKVQLDPKRARSPQPSGDPGGQSVGERCLFAAHWAAPWAALAAFSISAASAKSSALMPPASSVVRSTTTRSKTLDHSG